MKQSGDILTNVTSINMKQGGDILTNVTSIKINSTSMLIYALFYDTVDHVNKRHLGNSGGRKAHKFHEHHHDC